MKHEVFISRLDSGLQRLFSSVEITFNQAAIKNLAMSKWIDGKCISSRADAEKWERYEFEDFELAIESIIKLSLRSEIVGWLSFDFKGTHYQLSSEELQTNLIEIAKLLRCENGGYRDLSWVGETEDFGIIFEYNERQSPQFEICVWGI
ncbi:hypothetical protein PPIS_a3366 [Pseudoalteromonas piscicida]|uniref:Uncharacterized protein n=1 Tax=Pseudoalteromonas piscicida TaxID=43662 RepID=A0ABN5CF87_PSEO7|nr:hypothetical protein PPIS_a3366 [Pseudoalteromonas piscicida]